MSIAPGVDFDTVAREWRCKWSADGDKASLAAAQKSLIAVLDQVKAVDGFKSVQRVVCGGCLDFKIIVSLEAAKYGAWESAKFAPEETFLAALKSIDGLTVIETQTYTLMTL